MTVKQISVFLENKPGQLQRLAELFSSNDIDMRSLNLAESRDFGVARVIVDDAFNAARVLKEAGYVSQITPVVAVEIPDSVGGLTAVLKILTENEINLEYMYAFIARKTPTAYAVLRVADNEAAVSALVKAGLHPVCQDELAAL